MYPHINQKDILEMIPPAEQAHRACRSWLPAPFSDKRNEMADSRTIAENTQNDPGSSHMPGNKEVLGRKPHTDGVCQRSRGAK